MISPTPPEKSDGSDGGKVDLDLGNNTDAEVAHISDLATAPETMLESFSHLDEKKVLRKVRKR